MVERRLLQMRSPLISGRSYGGNGTGKREHAKCRYLQDNGSTVKADSTAPFDFTWTPAGLGNHTLAATPWSSTGGTGISVINHCTLYGCNRRTYTDSQRRKPRSSLQITSRPLDAEPSNQRRLMACTFSRPYLDDSGTSHRLQLQQLDRHRDGLLLGHNQPCFNHHGGSHHGDGYLYS